MTTTKMLETKEEKPEKHVFANFTEKAQCVGYRYAGFSAVYQCYYCADCATSFGFETFVNDMEPVFHEPGKQPYCCVKCGNRLEAPTVTTWNVFKLADNGDEQKLLGVFEDFETAKKYAFACARYYQSHIRLEKQVEK